MIDDLDDDPVRSRWDMASRLADVAAASFLLATLVPDREDDILRDLFSVHGEAVAALRSFAGRPRPGEVLGPHEQFIGDAATRAREGLDAALAAARATPPDWSAVAGGAHEASLELDDLLK